MPADSTRDPESMTADERRDEVASILARGLVRSIVAERARTSRTSGVLADCCQTCLELSGDLPLSVAPRPAGEGRAERRPLQRSHTCQRPPEPSNNRSTRCSA